MGAQANLTLNSHTFVPMGLSADGTATWAYNPSGIPSAAEVVTLQLRRPISARNGRNSPTNPRVYRLSVGFSKPIVQDDDTAFSPAGTLLRSYEFKGDLTIPETGATAERTDVKTVLKDFFASAEVLAAIESLTTPTS